MENRLQVIDFQKEGFLPLMSFADWRIAGLNYVDFIDPKWEVYSMEKHLETDEVFILTQGRAWLLIGETGDDYGVPELVQMKVGVVYNVRRLTWHGTLMEKDARILLVEKKDTGSEADTIRKPLDKCCRDKIAQRII